MRETGNGKRDAFTLVEVVVALAILGLVLGIATLAVGSLKMPSGSGQVAKLMEARAQAIRSGDPMEIEGVLFLPDGRAIGEGMDPLTGAPLARR